jgi:hypothetical protein
MESQNLNADIPLAFYLAAISAVAADIVAAAVGGAGLAKSWVCLDRRVVAAADVGNPLWWLLPHLLMNRRLRAAVDSGPALLATDCCRQLRGTAKLRCTG